MARVVFPDGFLPFTDGVRQYDTSAEIVRDLLAEVRQRWPELAPRLEKSALAIDGQIYQDAFLESIEPDSEVFFMSRIEGG